MKDSLNVNRPLSPHLTIYRPQLTSVLSILHRITGLGLILSLLLVVVWFIALSLGPGYYISIETFFESIIVRVVLGSSVWALWYHTCTGIRHLVWDAGYGLEEEWIAPSAYVIIFFSLALTLITLYLYWV